MKISFRFVVAGFFRAASHSQAADAIPLDQEFHLRLELPLKERASLAEGPLQMTKPKPDIVRPVPVPLLVPDNELPSGARAFKFNGQTYHYVPLRS
jgi:hypothetical protein